MTSIRLVSYIHGLWGASLLVIGDSVPRPYAALEPFLTYMPSQVVGYLFLVSAVIPILIDNYCDHGNRRNLFLFALSVLPQQLILYWGVAWGGWVMFVEFDPRTWLSWTYTVVLAFAHSRGAVYLYSKARYGV